MTCATLHNSEDEQNKIQFGYTCLQWVQNFGHLVLICVFKEHKKWHCLLLSNQGDCLEAFNGLKNDGRGKKYFASKQFIQSNTGKVGQIGGKTLPSYRAYPYSQMLSSWVPSTCRQPPGAARMSRSWLAILRRISDDCKIAGGK
jgi:hypothetical protein